MNFFNKEKTFQYYSSSRTVYFDGNLQEELSLQDGINYKLEFQKSYVKDEEVVVLNIEKMHASEEDSLYPEDSLKYELQKGIYIFEFENVPSIAEDKIWTSFGKVDKDVATGRYYAIIKNMKTDLLHIFIKSNEFKNHIYRNFFCRISKLKSIPKNKNNIKTVFVDKNELDSSYVFLDPDTIYNATLFSIVSKDFPVPTPKYPTGTYQTVYHSICSKINDISEYQSVVDIDKNNFDFNENKLSSLKNISIPKEVNPLSYYVLAGKIDVLIYFDYVNDKYFIQPNGCAEFFVTILLPEDKIELLEENETYSIFHVVDYEVVSNSFKNNYMNITAIKNWIRCTDKDIHIDEYELFYYVDSYRFFDWMHDHLLYAVDPLFLNIKLYDILADSFDDLSIKKNPDDILDWSITRCRWKLSFDKNAIVNRIDWNYSNEWVNINESSQNLIKTTSSGEGIARVTKKHFKLLTGVVDINESLPDGELNDEQFKQLTMLNGPEVAPFDRLQVFIQTRMTSH